MNRYNADMTFSELAKYLDKLEKISSRLEMTSVLAELFSGVTAEEGKIVAYLSQGLLGPKYDNPDTGMADKQVLKALQTLGEVDAEKVFKQEGDLGRTVQKIREQSSKFKIQDLSIGEVYEKLLQIAHVGGSGSVEGKSKLLVELVLALDPISAKYAVKMVLGKLRTGYSDMTVLDSLSWMAVGDKSLREQIEAIYNVRADLGEVVKMIKSHKAAEIKNIGIDPVVGTPVLPARAERAKTVEEIWERNGGPSASSGRQPAAAAEHKLDGLRIQAHVKDHKYLTPNPSPNLVEGNIRLFSRGMEDVTLMYPDIVEGLKKQVNTECILDGEMIAVGEDGKYKPFQETMSRKRKYDILEMMESVPLKYYVFDVLSCEQKNLLNEANEKRWKVLEGAVKEGNVVKLMPRKIIKNSAEIEEFFKQALEDGTEGIVVKKLDGVYKSGSRDFNWIKFKKSYDDSTMSDTVDAVIMGYDVGQGKRADFGIGDFLIGVRDEKSEKYLTIAKIGTGLTDDEWRTVKERCEKHKAEVKPEAYEVSKQMNCDFWVKPSMVVEILADEITQSPMHSSGLALRFPRLISFREKKPEDATSVEELNRLFKLQKK